MRLRAVSAAFCALAPIWAPEISLSSGIPHGDIVRTSGADIMKKARSGLRGSGPSAAGFAVRRTTSA
jgi:hypothetical protein